MWWLTNAIAEIKSDTEQKDKIGKLEKLFSVCTECELNSWSDRLDG